MARGSLKKPAKKGTGKKTGRRFGLFCLFLFVAATLVAGFYFMVLYPGKLSDRAVPTLSGQAKKKPLRQQAAPQTDLPRDEAPAPPSRTPVTAVQRNEPPQYPSQAKPRVAIIIDDMGYRQDTGRALLALDLPLSFSFLPFTPFSEALQQQARAKGRDILLHLPLEPMDPKWKASPGTLSTAMNPETMATIFQQDLRAVPKALGVNNHMGSRFTASPQAMRTLLPLLREHGLFFLDSVTTSESVAYDLAREMGVKTQRRTVFLDNDQSPDKIRAQLDRLVRLAGEHGQAVAIGHPYPATVEALRRYQGELRARTEMVGVSSLVH